MKLRQVAGWLMLAVGLSVFLIRFQHAGPYALPQKGNLLAGVLALLLGALLVRAWFGDGGGAIWLNRLALLACIPVLFFALYATLAEIEEVVILRAADAQGDLADLRLWIVERDAAAWVQMGAPKANAHTLTDVELELLRDGVSSCVVAQRFDDLAEANETHHQRTEKYAVQRLAIAIGLFSPDATDDTVTFRLTPCPAEG